MEFVDNTGHIFSLPSYDKKPIGFEYEENPYIFWIDSQESNHLSINNYYARTINVLFEVEDNTIEIDDKYEFEISMDSKIFTLISPVKFNENIDKLSSIKDYVDIINESQKTDMSSQILNNDDLLVIKTSEKSNGASYHYLLIPIYVLCNAEEEGTWTTNIMIHIHDNDEETDDVWCPITVGGIFIDDYEALIIDGKNMGVNLPKDILRAVYSKSFYDNEFDHDLYNDKLKEYLINYMTIRGECGNFRSVIDSFKWFGWGNKLTVSKLIKTDNEFQDQYILDYFNLSTDILDSFRTFRNTTYISIYVSLNIETDDEYEQNFNNYFWGEGKPKLIDLMNHYIKVNVGHDLDIPTDREKYWYWQPYYNFTFTELGLKLSCLKYYIEKYFLPIHLKIHTASLAHKVFANDIKLSAHEKITLTDAPLIIGSSEKDVEFLGNGVHYFTKQIHWMDDSFNEFDDTNDIEDWYYMNDTCTNIPIKFLVKSSNNYPKYHDCVLLLERKLPNDKYNYVVYIDNKLSINDKIQIYKYGYNENMSFEDKLSYKMDMTSMYFSYKTESSDNWSLFFKGYDKMIAAINNSTDEILVKFKYDEEKLGAISINGSTYKLNDNYDEYYYVNDVHVEHMNATELIYESHFKLLQNMPSTTYKNFIIYPKMLNIKDQIDSRNINYWANKDYVIRILCNGRWYEYDFTIKIPDVTMYFGKLEYKYWLTDNNWLMYKLHLADPEHDWSHAAAFILSNKYIALSKAKNALAYGNISDDDVNITEISNKISERLSTVLESNVSQSSINEIFGKIKDDNFAIFYENLRKEGMTDNFLRNWQFVDFTNRYMSNFSQLRKLTNEEVGFNSFMHNHGLVDVNNINFDINFFKILKYNLDNHLQYIDGKYLDNDEFYHYIVLDDGQKIIIGNELVGKNFKVPINYLSSYNIMVFFYMNMYYVLREEGHNITDDPNPDKMTSNMWKIVWTGTFDEDGHGYDTVFSEESLVLLEEDDLDSGLFVEFIYIREDDEYEDPNGGRRKIYERLNNDQLSINDKYISNVNIPKADKYLNNIHLFNIYKTYEDKKNILIFHNDINMTCNGLLFEHSKYDQYDLDSTKIYISGNMFKSNDPESEIDKGLLHGADTREPDIYTKYWNDGEPDIKEIPVKKYVYYQETDNFGNPIPKSYSTSLFSIYEDKEYTPICTIISKSVDDFENGIFVENTQRKSKSYVERHYYFGFTNKENIAVNENGKYIGILSTENLNKCYSIDDSLSLTYDGSPNYVMVVPINFYNMYANGDLDSGFTNGFINYSIGNNDLKLHIELENIHGIGRFEGHDYYIIDIDEIPLNPWLTPLEETEYEDIVSVYKSQKEYEGSEDHLNNTPALWLRSESTIDTSDEDDHKVKVDRYWVYSVDGKDYDVYYRVSYVRPDSHGNWIAYEPMASEYANNSIKGFKIEFLYKKKYMTKNIRIEHNGNENIHIDNDGNKYVDLGQEKGIAYVIEYDSMMYYDRRPSEENGFGARIQNPGMYWFNADKNGFETLKDSLESLKKYWPYEKDHGEYIDSKTFIIKDDNIEIQNYISSKKEQQYNVDIYNETESKTWSKHPSEMEEEFRNYLTKEITGLEGKFSLDYTTNDDRLKLVVAIEDSEGNTRLVEGKGTIFELDGNEREVLAFLQVDENVVDEAVSFNDMTYWINPIINRIYIKKDLLKYNTLPYSDDDLIRLKFKGKEYVYGNNTSNEDVTLYNDFFYECYTAYGISVDNNGNFISNGIRSAYEGIPMLHMMLDYDFYLMHDHEYWYGIFISRETIDKALDREYLKIPESDKTIIVNPKNGDFQYILEYVRSDNQMLINRMRMVESNGINHFKRDDIVWTALWNNNRLPINIDIGTKWVYEPMSIGMTKTISNVSNSEVCIMPVPNGDNSYPIGYYDVTVRYSLDRDVNHQVTKKGKIRII